MKKAELEKLLGCELGVCAFSEVAEHLLPCRNILKIPKKAQSVILFVFPYKVKEEPPKNISRYAAVPDYHEICGNILKKHTDILKKAFPDNEFEWFIDNSPIPEVEAAVLAGLGVKGKNGLLITKKYGSFVFIGEIVTDLEVESTSLTNNCIGCDVCQKACPVGLSKEKCLSSLSQKKGELNAEESMLLKNSGCVWGCDICSSVCPMNKGAEFTYIKEFVDGYRDSYIVGEDISGRAYAWRGEKVIKRNFDIIKDR